MTHNLPFNQAARLCSSCFEAPAFQSSTTSVHMCHVAVCSRLLPRAPSLSRTSEAGGGVISIPTDHLHGVLNFDSQEVGARAMRGSTATPALPCPH